MKRQLADFQPHIGYTGAFKSISCSTCPASNPPIPGTILARPISARHIPDTQPMHGSDRS